jgi:hypothetical protein
MRIPEFRKLIYKDKELPLFLIERDILRVPICKLCQKAMTQTMTNLYKYRCYLRRDLKNVQMKGQV